MAEVFKDVETGVGMADRKEKKGRGDVAVGSRDGGRLKLLFSILCSTPQGGLYIFILSVRIGTQCLEMKTPSNTSAWPICGHHLSCFLL